MYYMIHASDHPQAPEFMGRAYEAAVRPLAPEQPRLFDTGAPTQGYTRKRSRAGWTTQEAIWAGMRYTVETRAPHVSNSPERRSF
jgi:hypothetical protein